MSYFALSGSSINYSGPHIPQRVHTHLRFFSLGAFETSLGKTAQHMYCHFSTRVDLLRRFKETTDRIALAGRTTHTAVRVVRAQRQSSVKSESEPKELSR